MLKGLFDPGYKELKRVEKIAYKVDALAEEYKKLSDDDLKNNTIKFKERIKNGETLDDVLVEAFATVREASTRVLHMTPFLVQIMGALALHGGNIAEMKTGEGKTLTSTMVAYLNALSGQGVHIVTVNEYLASRDAREMGELFTWLGLTVGLNLRELSADEKRAAYNCDITYTTNSELGFDYLRDHMVIFKEQMVQRTLNFAIVDEVDSILIDEARTPLIISGGEKNTGNLYQQADLLVKSLKNDEEDPDYEVDEKSKIVTITERGIEKAERFFKIDNLYDVAYVNILHHIHNALKANYAMKKDVEYVVSEGKVIIVDPFTGRLMHGRQYSDGLHQALEAKEHVEIKKETRTIATITYQNFFRMYKKLAGMTGTAKTEEEEFRNIYNMYVVEVPTNVPVIRIDEPDLMFITMKAKFENLADDVEERFKKGQPVLIGTVAVETSELISNLLTRRHIPHNVLNAKNHEREAEIIANAGQKGAVTIATNMAGRGTDIKLGPGVKELGGLAVIGSERHESRRIDNQLRGRSGRQGDPGYTRFYLSSEDELMRRFGSDRFKGMLSYLVIDKKNNNKETALESKMFSKFVESAQKKVEGSNYDSRKTVLEYDEVLRKQREIIYGQRAQILFEDDITEIIHKMMYNSFDRICEGCIDPNGRKGMVDPNKLDKETQSYFDIDVFKPADFEGLNTEEATDMLFNKSVETLKQKEVDYPHLYKEFLKVVLLRIIDTYWMNHIDDMSELRQAVRLQAYAQVNPLREYQDIGFRKFDTMICNIEQDTTRALNRARIQDNTQRQEVVKPTGTNAGEETKKRQAISKKVGRNHTCPCGSGKKYKNCCGRS